MRKLVLVLLVALLSVPALAANPSVTLVAGANPGEVDVRYTSDGDANSLPSGFGLTVTANNGATFTNVKNFKTDGESSSTSKGYGIYPGQLVISGGVLTPNSPLTDEPGTGIGTGTVVLEFGALYKRGTGASATDANAPLANGRLCTVVVSGNCTVTVAGDDDRCGTGKGIIAQNYVAYPVSDSLGVSVSVPAATVTGITPSTGVYGSTITITNLAGTGFVSGATVKLTKSGSADIAGTDVVFVSATELECKFVLPYLAIAGTWNVVVTNPDADPSTQTVAFVVTAPNAPTVTSILPTGGAAGYTTSVADLKGTNFVSGATVKLTKSGSSDIAATNVVVASGTKITCDLAIPAGAAAGTWNVVVTNTDARSATKTNAFTVGDCFADGLVGSAQRTAYTKWVNYNKPSCWCFKKQCRGDADGVLTLTKPVMSPDLTIWKAGFNQSAAYVKDNVSGTASLICADFDHKDTLTKPVMSPDLTIWKEYFNDLAATVPQCDASPVPTNAAVTFWTN